MPDQSPALQGQVYGVRIVGTSALFRFGAGQRPVQTAGQSRHHLIL
jgi:hypothetical protein